MRKLLFVGLVVLSSNSIHANECETIISSNDAMQFDTSSIEVPVSCASFKVTLQHTGQLPKMAMGHNWVLSTTADAQSVATDGMSAGLNNNYIKTNDDRVIAYTPIIGGGEKTSVTFNLNKLSANESYTFFCSFPGHIGVMKGTLTLKAKG